MVEVRCPKDGTSLGDFEAHDANHYKKTKKFYSKLCPQCGMVWFFKVYTDGTIKVDTTATAILHEK
ncbi:MAG: hypothetical protein ACE5OW_06400 [Candidatus Bathyarchaeia archaeon]